MIIKKRVVAHVRSIEKFLTGKFITWTKRLITFMNSQGKSFDAERYFNYLTELRLVNNKQELNFIFKLLEECGTQISFVEKQYWIQRTNFTTQG